jgi:glycosyltransferase involved in cell wall biosynthesis
MPVLISAVVCTFNRAELLKGALESLCRQTLERSLYEIIVVDNNSSDNTHEVVLGFGHHGNIRYCSETRQGLSHARNRGWHEARGGWVAYLDDDCKVPPEWLAVAREVIEQVSPDVLGGPSHPFYDTPKPDWFEDRYASQGHGQEARPLYPNEYLSGMNIMFHRSLLEDVGGFDPELGMCGAKIAYGEETDLLRRTRASLPDALIYYDPRLLVHHLVRPEKMSVRWLARQRFADGRYSHLVFLRDRQTVPSRDQVLRAMLGTLLAFSRDMIRSVFRRDRVRYPYVQNYLCEQAFVHLRELGQLYEGLRPQPKQTSAPECAP